MEYVFSTKEMKRYRFPTHINDLVMDRSQAAASEVFVVELAPGEAPPLHQHHDTEQIFYILEGNGRLEIGPELTSFPVKPGEVVRIPPTTLHRIHCLGTTTLRYLAVDCFPNGRPQAEPTWDSHVRTMCCEQSWNYEAIVAG
jgi:mannose-6-phosphate isomerase-like protein (cupin superfamily)